MSFPAPPTWKTVFTAAHTAGYQRVSVAAFDPGTVAWWRPSHRGYITASFDRSRPFPWRVELFNGKNRTVLHDPSPTEVLAYAAPLGILG